MEYCEQRRGRKIRNMPWGDSLSRTDCEEHPEMTAHTRKNKGKKSFARYLDSLILLKYIEGYLMRCKQQKTREKQENFA